MFTVRNLLFKLIQIVLVAVRAQGVAAMVPEGGEKGDADKTKRKQSKKLINNRQNLIEQNIVLESNCQ